MKQIKLVSYIKLFLLFFIASLSPLNASSLNFPNAKVNFIPGYDLEDERKIIAALELELKDEWKTYWKYPGDVGKPLTIDISQSTNIKSVEILWPAPVRFSSFGFDSIGYKKKVTLPIKIEAIDFKKPMKGQFDIQFLVCKDQCIPYDGVLENITDFTSDSEKNKKKIEDSLKKVPFEHSDIIELKNIELQSDDQIVLRLASKGNQLDPSDVVDVFIQNEEGFTFGRIKPEREIIEDTKNILIYIPIIEGFDKVNKITGKTLNITVTTKIGSISSNRIVLPKNPLTGKTIFYFFILAVLGGLILNGMPCVLPVLSLKVLSLVGYIGKNSSEKRMGFLITALGIMTTFLAFGLGASILKYTGQLVGWGVQYQEPLFIGGMVILLTIFAANLWGLFDFILSPSVQVVIQKFEGKSYSKNVKDFLSGVLATLLATPCTAPFLGTAVTFAISQNFFSIMLIFFGLGLGMAIPYILIAVLPRGLIYVPKPGAWMGILKRVLGAGLFATALWLMYVLSNQVNQYFINALSFLLLMALIYLWHKRNGKTKKRKYGTMLLASGIFATYLIIQAIFPSSTPKLYLKVWHPFDQERIMDHLENGKIVLVNVTADWCLTCKYNETLVYNQKKVIKHLSRPEIVPMRADWTNHDQNISAFLSKYKKYGIPFSIVFGPENPQGIILPELLTSTDIVEAISLVSKNKIRWD